MQIRGGVFCNLARLSAQQIQMSLFTRAPHPQGIQVIKGNRFPRQKGGHGARRQSFHAWTVETGDKTSLFVSTVFCGEFFGKNRALYFDVTYKDVDRFRKGSVHELYSLKASQVSKVHA